MVWRSIDRHALGELQNHVIDEYVSGRISRRQFLRAGSMFGLAATLPLGFGVGIREGSGAGDTSSRSQLGTIRVGVPVPNERLEPTTWGSDAGKALGAQVGDFLVWVNNDLEIEPRLATQWAPNDDASTWVFTIREGVKFSDGRILTARDVAATFNWIANPDSGSYALSAFKDVLEPGGAVAVDDVTVEFTLQRPTGYFPYLVSNETFNAVIMPEDHEPGTWGQTFIGTGPWRVDNYNPERGIEFLPNTDYWDRSRQPLPARHEMKFFASSAGITTELLSGNIDALVSFAVGSGQALVRSPDIVVQEHPSSTHVQIHLRCDEGPFQDKRVRRALALAVDRSSLVSGLMQGRAMPGNDSPFAPVFSSSDFDREQRSQDMEEARRLLSESGVSDGFQVPFYGDQRDEARQLAVGIQDAGKQLGIALEPLNIMDDVTYYEKYWLDSTIGLSTFGHRSTPHFLLSAVMVSDAPWNAAHYSNATFDALARDFLTTPDLQGQRELGQKLEGVLLEDTPIIVPYFKHHLGAVRAEIDGVVTTSTLQYDVTRATKVA